MHIVFIIGMHRCGTSFLASTYTNKGFSIGKNKNKDIDWQNPRGYFENDSFTEFHTRLLEKNGKSWKTIRHQCIYDDSDVAEYRKLIEQEFGSDKMCVIKDPRLTFMVGLIKEACENDIDYKIVFATRNKTECVRSLCKAQKIKHKDAEELYEASHKQIEDFEIVDYKQTRENSELYDPKLYREKV